MLLIRCAACRAKLWRYEKYGQGEVLRCHKDRIGKTYGVCARDGRVFCRCGKDIGIDKGSYFKMISKAFTYKGTKLNR